MNLLTYFLDLSWWSSILVDYVLHPLITVLLSLLSVFVVLGNLLVVSAIWHEHQLHSVTNYLVASLAAADCLVGAIVMPFSIISEIIVESWTFGAIWCDIWHSFDVLASTASIMNLCAISLDRYLAITNPISYPTKMTPRRVALLIVSLWTCSSLISFPAILWWRAVAPSPLQQLPPIRKISPLARPFNATLPDSLDETPKYKCVFTDDPYYLLFSSFISFYGPLCVMLYAYYRIYKAAVKQTRFLKHGSKEVIIGKHKKRRRAKYISEQPREGSYKNNRQTNASCSVISSIESYDRQHLVLRAHRGGGGSTIRKSSSGEKKSNKINSRKKRELQSLSKIIKCPDANPKNASKQTSSDSSQTLGRVKQESFGATRKKMHTKSVFKLEATGSNMGKETPSNAILLKETNNTSPIRYERSLTIDFDSEGVNYENNSQVIPCNSEKVFNSIVDLSAVRYIDGSQSHPETVIPSDECKDDKIDEKKPLGKKIDNDIGTENNIIILPSNRQHRSVGKRLSKLAKERKAAKTLGIVVGVFILCWLPFFVVNIVVALCGSSCITRLQLLVSIITWLGWLNSAMNPVIYACWSRDFRRAFRRVLCSWVEFACPYDNALLARKLKLQKNSNYSTQDTSLSYF